MKKNIIFVKDMHCQHCVAKIQEKLEETKLDFTIDLSQQAVIVEGGPDEVYTAKAQIREAGYTVQ